MVGCPVIYNESQNAYEVDFQWRAPFSAAALSHINRFVMRGDVLERGPINDVTLVIQVGAFRDYLFANVRP